jgi:hypothetical protein
LEKQERNLKTEIDILDRKFRIIEQMVALVMVEGHILTHYREVIDYQRNNRDYPQIGRRENWKVGKGFSLSIAHNTIANNYLKHS